MTVVLIEIVSINIILQVVSIKFDEFCKEIYGSNNIQGIGRGSSDDRWTAYWPGEYCPNVTLANAELGRWYWKIPGNEITVNCNTARHSEVMTCLTTFQWDTMVDCNGIKHLLFSMLVQSDPDLPGCSGERVLPGKSGCPVYRGQIPLVSKIGGKFILPVYRGSGKSGPSKSGSDCSIIE